MPAVQIRQKKPPTTQQRAWVLVTPGGLLSSPDWGQLITEPQRDAPQPQIIPEVLLPNGACCLGGKHIQGRGGGEWSECAGRKGALQKVTPPHLTSPHLPSQRISSRPIPSHSAPHRTAPPRAPCSPAPNLGAPNMGRPPKAATRETHDGGAKESGLRKRASGN